MSAIVWFDGLYLVMGMLAVLAIFFWGFVCSLVPRKTLGLLLTLLSFTIQFILFPHAIFYLQGWVLFFPWNVVGLLGYGVGFLAFRANHEKKKEGAKP